MNALIKPWSHHQLMSSSVWTLNGVDPEKKLVETFIIKCGWTKFRFRLANIHLYTIPERCSLFFKCFTFILPARWELRQRYVVGIGNDFQLFERHWTIRNQIVYATSVLLCSYSILTGSKLLHLLYSVDSEWYYHLKCTSLVCGC